MIQTGDDADSQLATDYAQMIVERYRKSGQPMFPLGAALVFQAGKILSDEGLALDQIADTFEALADLARAGTFFEQRPGEAN